MATKRAQRWASVQWLILLLFGMGPVRAGSKSAGEEGAIPMPTLTGETGPPVAAVFFVDDSIFGGPLRPIVLIWKNGRVVWSRNALKGGPPYRLGNVGAQRVQKLLNDLDRRGLFTDPVRNSSNRGPDYPYTTISVAAGRKRLSLASWHEAAETGKTAVATSGGIELLDGRDRAQVLAAQPASYRRFRQIWDEARTVLIRMIPTGGRDAGKLEFRIRWLPESSDH